MPLPTKLSDRDEQAAQPKLTMNCIRCGQPSYKEIYCSRCDVNPLVEAAPTREETVATPARGSLPRRPWVASCQYGNLKFILSQDNEILWRVPEWLPMETLRAMVVAANDQLAENEKISDQRP